MTRATVTTLATLAFVLGITATPGYSGSLTTAKAAATQSGGQADPDKPFEYVSPEVARLEMFVGAWSVTERHFNAQGELAATVNGSEEIAWQLDRRSIRRTYTTGTGTTVYRAVGMLTWNDVEKKYHGVWFDNVSTAGPSTTKGNWDEETRTMTFTVESLNRDGSMTRYKVVEQLQGEDHRTATTYLLDGKKTVKRMEVEYKRAVRCPARIRPIFDE
jgi:hypothetical protein